MKPWTAAIICGSLGLLQVLERWGNTPRIILTGHP
jgi:hypothetical protein